MKINKKVVQVSLWKGAVPRRLAWEARTQVEAGGGGVWVSLQLSRRGRGLAQEGAGHAGGAGQGAGRRAGSTAGPCHRVDSRDESRMSS